MHVLYNFKMIRIKEIPINQAHLLDAQGGASIENKDPNQDSKSKDREESVPSFSKTRSNPIKYREKLRKLRANKLQYNPTTK